MLPWVPEGFFFRSEAAIVSGEAAIVIHAREKKNPLDAAVTSLTSMRFSFELACWLVFVRSARSFRVITIKHWISLVKPLQSTAGAMETGFLARRNNKQAIWLSSVRIGYRIYRNIRVKTCTRRGLASLRQAGRCVCGTADWMREIFNLPTRAQSLWIFTRSRFWISQGCNFSCCLSVKRSRTFKGSLHICLFAHWPGHSWTRRTFMTPFNDRSFAFLHLAIIFAVSRIVAPRADLSITKNKQIPQKPVW